VTSLSESSQGEVGDNRVKWGDFLEKLIAINRNIVLRPSEVTLPKFSKQLKSCRNWFVLGFFIHNYLNIRTSI
jgi:hypothetical protein